MSSASSPAIQGKSCLTRPPERAPGRLGGRPAGGLTAAGCCPGGRSEGGR
jgi:hypothetical protein